MFNNLILYENDNNMNDKTKTIITSITILTAITIALQLPSAEAFSCTAPGHCYAKNNFYDDASGFRYDSTVTNLGPSCPSSDEPTVTAWVVFPNGYFIENGFTSGNLAGSCYTTEKYYYGYKNTSTP